MAEKGGKISRGNIWQIGVREIKFGKSGTYLKEGKAMRGKKGPGYREPVQIFRIKNL